MAGNEVSDRVLFDPWSNVLIASTHPCDGVNLSFPAGTNKLQGTYRAQNSIQAAGSVISPRAVIFNAGSEIDLLANFEVYLGAELLIEIKDCTP